MHTPLHPLLKLALTAALILCLSSSCSSRWDGLEECDQGLRLKIEVLADQVYGSKHTDAILSSVLADATLLVFDANGQYRESFTQDGETLRTNSMIMDLPLPKGEYQIIAWLNTEGNYYTLPTLTPGTSTLTDLTLRLTRDAQNRQDSKLPTLWYGILTDMHVANTNNQLFRIGVVKDTNTVTCLLQDTSGKDLSGTDFSYDIIAGNGYMNHLNALLTDTQVTYGSYLQESVAVSTTGGTRATQLVARSESNTLRFMADQETRFVVKRKTTGTQILNINLTEYLLLVRERFAGSIGTRMDDQQYLDYEDTYNITFFLDPSGTGGGEGEDDETYTCTTVSINGWIVRINESEFE